MQHTIPLDQLGAQGPAMAHAVEACVHCGFCLPACPTYKILGEEMDSPRGRIVLMKSALEGQLTVEETAPFIDQCLGCLACIPVCPSGVPYGELVMPFREYAEQRRTRKPMDRLERKLVNETLPYPERFRFAATIGRLARPFSRLVPKELRGMLAMLPDHLPPSQPLPALYPAEGQRRARVALLAGCVQQVLAPEINWATLRVLAKNGVETVIPAGQGCCGALPMHQGEEKRGRELALRNLRVFPKDVDAVVTNAAGCGSGIKEYGLLFRGDPAQNEAEVFAGQVKDVSVFLAELGLVSPPPLQQPLKLAYHDACHLSNAQGITEPPRLLLKSISNLTLLEVPDGDMCCGSAGVYNLEQPEIANQLGQRKAENILRTGGEGMVAGNIGCLVQIRTHLQRLDKPLPVYHTIQVLDQAYAQMA